MSADYNDREYPIERIRTMFLEWERKTRIRMMEYRSWEAMLDHRFWDGIMGVDSGRYSGEAMNGQTWVEVDALYPFLMSYTAALHNPDADVLVRKGTGRLGNADKAYDTLRMWRHQVSVVQSLQQTDLLSTMYDGCGVKVWFDRHKKDVLRRVMVKVIPWWELMTDTTVHNRQEQGFVAHVYWMPVQRAIRFFRDRSIVGQPVPDDSMTVGDVTRTAPYPGDATTQPTQQNMVRVVEFYNAMDTYCRGESDLDGFPSVLGPEARGSSDSEALEDGGPTVVEERGRMEVFLPYERGGWERPRLVFPFAFRDINDDPVLPVKVQTLMSRPGFPLDGRAQTPRVFDLAREQNIERSIQATVIRRDMPQLCAPEGMFNSEAKTAYARGQYGVVHEYAESIEGAAAKVFVMPSPNLPYNHDLYRRDIRQDIDRASLQPPATRGRITGATATEVLEANKGGQGEVNVLETNKHAFLVDVYSTVLLAIQKSIEANGPDARLYVAAGTGEATTYQEVSAADLAGDFWIEINPGEPTLIHEDRQAQKYRAFLSDWLPLAATWLKDANPVTAIAMDEMVRRYLMPDRFFTANLPRTPIPDEARVAQGPGAKSAIPGQASSAPVEAPTSVGVGATGGPAPVGVAEGYVQDGLTPGGA